MTNKVFLVFVVMLSMTVWRVTADENNQKPVPLTVVVINPDSEHGSLPKSPIEIPEVYLNGNVLSFDAALEGRTVQLLDEDETVVFSDFIEENQTSLVLPSTLSGTYELQIVCGNIIFYAIIEL